MTGKGPLYDHETLIDRAIEEYYNRTNANRNPIEPGSVQRAQCRVTNEDGRMYVELYVRNAPGQPEQVDRFEVVDRAPELVPVDRDAG